MSLPASAMRSPHVTVSSDPALPPEVVAPIALLIDVDSGRILFERQSHRRFVPASLTKIMTSYVAFELIAQRKLSLNQAFPMRPETFRAWHGVGSTMFLENNSQTRVADLLEGIVTVSANDGCVVLGEGVAGSVPGFTAMMNAQARRLGMRDTHYNTPNGWMDEGRTYVSAADLATLSMAMITRHPVRAIDHAVKRVVIADGVKTGFTNEAGYGLVGSAQRGGRRLMMVIGGYDRPQDRARDGAALLEWGFAAFDAQPLFRAGDHLGSARVQGGAAPSVDLVAPHPLALLLPHGQRAKPTLTIRYKGPLRAPIAKGQDIATLIVRAPGQPDARLPLVAGETVPAGGALDRLRNGFAAMVGS